MPEMLQEVGGGGDSDMSDVGTESGGEGDREGDGEGDGSLDLDFFLWEATVGRAQRGLIKTE